MKTLNCICLAFAFIFFAGCTSSKQEKAEILLVGVFHNIPDSIADCNWQPTYQKLVNYQPDQIAVEEVSPDDSASLIQNFGENYRHLFDSVTLVYTGSKINAADSIRHYYNLLLKKEDPALRLQLWKYYHLGLDMGNRDFQSYQILQNFNNYTSLIDTNKAWDKSFWIKYQRFVTGRKNSEFYNLIYPLAMKMGVNYLYPTDNRITYPIQSEAYQKFAEELEHTEYMKRQDSFWVEFVKTEALQLSNCNGLPFVNSLTWLEKTDYGQAHILDDADNAAYRKYADVWYQRNESIAERIIKAAQQSKAKKMAVFYGYMHVAPVKKFLEQQGYVVKLIGDLK
ncbi:MAG: DUF5694 domain-containing protein [Ferruginibacter sp.]